MKHKSKKSISFILALLLVILQCGVLSVRAASSSKGKTVYFFNNGGKEGTSASEQTVNLATQDIVEGVSEVYVINPLIEGESANLGEYVTLDRALSDEPVEGMPIISVENCAPALGEEFALNVNLQNVPQLSGYVVNLANIRLESALRDIVDENKTVTDAAFDKGFTSVKLFIELCKKVYDCTPGQYPDNIKLSINNFLSAFLQAESPMKSGFSWWIRQELNLQFLSKIWN